MVSYKAIPLKIDFTENMYKRVRPEKKFLCSLCVFKRKTKQKKNKNLKIYENGVKMIIEKRYLLNKKKLLLEVPFKFQMWVGE